MITQYAPTSERVTAVLTSHMAETGENFDGAITIGVYPHSSTEIWMDFAGQRVNVQTNDVRDLCKQLKRAVAIAQELP